MGAHESVGYRDRTKRARRSFFCKGNPTMEPMWKSYSRCLPCQRPTIVIGTMAKSTSAEPLSSRLGWNAQVIGASLPRGHRQALERNLEAAIASSSAAAGAHARPPRASGSPTRRARMRAALARGCNPRRDCPWDQPATFCGMPSTKHTTPVSAPAIARIGPAGARPGLHPRGEPLNAGAGGPNNTSLTDSYQPGLKPMAQRARHRSRE